MKNQYNALVSFLYRPSDEPINYTNIDVITTDKSVEAIEESLATELLDSTWKTELT